MNNPYIPKNVELLIANLKMKVFIALPVQLFLIILKIWGKPILNNKLITLNLQDNSHLHQIELIIQCLTDQGIK